MLSIELVRYKNPVEEYVLSEAKIGLLDPIEAVIRVNPIEILLKIVLNFLSNCNKNNITYRMRSLQTNFDALRQKEDHQSPLMQKQQRSPQVNIKNKD